MKTPLARLLSLVAAAEAAGGDIDADDAARLLGIHRSELAFTVDALSNFGVHPYEPPDFLDLELDDDRVVLHHALGLDQSLRLPPLDVALLQACLRAVRGSLEGAGRELCDRTASSLSAAHRQPVEPLTVAYAVEPGPSTERLERARQAALERRQARITYWNASRDSVDERTVRPTSVLQHKGRWYLEAWCLQSDGSRHFRMDRVLSLELTDEVFDPADLSSPSARRDVLFDPPTQEVQVVVRFPAARVPAARRFFEGGRHSPVALDERRLRLSAPALPVLFRSLLTFGPPFRVEGPGLARDEWQRWLEQSIR